MESFKYLLKSRLTTFVFVSSVSLFSTANAALLNQWGTFTLTAGDTCVGDPCNSFTDTVIGPADFAPQSTTSDITFQDATHGSSEAHATLGGGTGLNMPTLRAQAAANSGFGTIGVARGVDAYTYVGASSTRIDLIVTLTGTLTNPNDARFTRILADIFVMDADAAEAMFSLGGNSVLQQSSLPTPNSTSTGLFPGNPLGIAVSVISFDLNPGDSFYLLANLATQAFDMGTAVSMSSLTMSFSDETNLVAASAAVVPVPAAVWLFCSGLIVLVGFVKRK